MGTTDRNPCTSLIILLATLCSMAHCTGDPGSPQSSAAQDSDITELRLRHWQPKSMLKTRVTRVPKPAFPVIDAHNHLSGSKDPVHLLREMDRAQVQTVVNLDGWWGSALEEQLDRYDRAYPGRFLTYARINFKGFADSDWTARELARLKEGFNAGAKGLKISKSLGLQHRNERTGKLISIDDPKLAPLFQLAGEMGRPVAIHSADPAAFFRPLDRFNERWHELMSHPDWLFHDKKYPSRLQLWRARNRVIARHRQTTFVGAHMGNNPEDLATVGKWLDEYPNFFVDIDARVSELGRQPYTARRFFIQYQDRILFGTDTAPMAKMYEVYYRFLETDDEYWDCSGGHHLQGFWRVYGIYLPKEVLAKIYHATAARILHLPSAN